MDDIEFPFIDVPEMVEIRARGLALARILASGFNVPKSCIDDVAMQAMYAIEEEAVKKRVYETSGIRGVRAFFGKYRVRWRVMDQIKKRNAGEVPMEFPHDVANAHDDSPDSMAIRKEEIEYIKKTLKRLPEEYRLVLELHHFCGLTVTETAERLGRTTGSTRGLLQRAKAAFGKLFATEDWRSK